MSINVGYEYQCILNFLLAGYQCIQWTHWRILSFVSGWTAWFFDISFATCLLLHRCSMVWKRLGVDYVELNVCRPTFLGSMHVRTVMSLLKKHGTLGCQQKMGIYMWFMIAKLEFYRYFRQRHVVMSVRSTYCQQTPTTIGCFNRTISTNADQYSFDILISFEPYQFMQIVG